MGMKAAGASSGGARSTVSGVDGRLRSDAFSSFTYRRRVKELHKSRRCTEEGTCCIQAPKQYCACCYRSYDRKLIHRVHYLAPCSSFVCALACPVVHAHGCLFVCRPAMVCPHAQVDEKEHQHSKLNYWSLKVKQRHQYQTQRLTIEVRFATFVNKKQSQQTVVNEDHLKLFCELVVLI